MIRLCNHEMCNGCEACSNVCPENAITMKENERGFLHPFLDAQLCTECGICKRACSFENPLTYENSQNDIYAVWNKNTAERKNSTSGGAFMLIARKIIKQGGVVYGAAFDKSLEISHIRVNNEKDLHKLRGSKYVQSRIGNVYSDAKKDLFDGKSVLFSGTPCQIAGLRRYLGEQYDLLYCIDVVCHGVPSPMVFEDYLKYIRWIYKKKIAGINFRYKKPCWTVYSMKVDFEDGTSYISSKFKDPFLRFFLAGGVT